MVTKSHHTNIEFSSLDSHPSMKEAIQSILCTSVTKIKNCGLNKNTLERKIAAHEVLNLPPNLVNNGHINPSYSGTKVELIEENEFFIALNKPPGVHSHPLDYLDTNNCLSFLRNINMGKYLCVNSNQYDRGLLYRLDYETSGVLLYVKTGSHYEHLRSNFKQLIKTKEYLAIVSGQIKSKQTIVHYLKPWGKKGSKMVQAKDDSNGQYCSIQIEPIKYDPRRDQTLLKVLLFEGVRHQIRSQLSILGHPIIGDTLYGGIDDDRMYLHAYKYSVQIDEKMYKFVSNSGLFFSRFLDFDSRL